MEDATFYLIVRRERVACGPAIAFNNRVRRIKAIKTTRWLTALLAAGFLLRAFIPVGYMPGNLLDGRFVELCPVGISFDIASASLSASHSADHSDMHHAGHHDTAADADPNKTCPLGLGIKFLAVPVVDLDLPTIEPPSFSVARLIDAGVVRTPPSPQQPRAPPATIPA